MPVINERNKNVGDNITVVGQISPDVALEADILNMAVLTKSDLVTVFPNEQDLMTLDRRMTLASFGSEVRQWRRARGFTQKELAERAGVSRSTLSDIEAGSTTDAGPGLGIIDRLLRVCGKRLVPNVVDVDHSEVPTPLRGGKNGNNNVNRS